jgi:hypothetical protein
MKVQSQKAPSKLTGIYSEYTSFVAVFKKASQSYKSDGILKSCIVKARPQCGAASEARTRKTILLSSHILQVLGCGSASSDAENGHFTRPMQSHSMLLFPGFI